MTITGEEVLKLIVGCVLVWVSIISAIDAWHVLRGRTTDNRGRTLWCYKKVDGMPIGAGGRKQALILNVGMAVIAMVIGLPLIADFAMQVLKHKI